MLPQFMDRELRSIEHVIGHSSDRREQLTLQRDRFENWTVGVQGMRPAGFAEPPYEDGIRRFKKPQRHFERRIFFPLVINGGKLAQGLALAYIDNHRRFCSL